MFIYIYVYVIKNSFSNNDRERFLIKLKKETRRRTLRRKLKTIPVGIHILHNRL